MLGDLRAWLTNWADSPAGPAALGVITASEAIFFPIPPDPLLIALALRNPSSALWLAALTTATSVAGGVVGHWLGLRLGRPLLQRFKINHVDRVERLFRRHGFWAVVIAGFTPLPFKLFTISAGVLAVPRTPFILASIVGRGLRFFIIGILIFFWGERVERFLDGRFELVMIVMAALLLGAIGAWVAWAAWQRGRDGRAAPGAGAS